MDKRGWYCRSKLYEWGPFITERDAVEFGRSVIWKDAFATYYGYFFNYRKHKEDDRRRN